MKVWGLDEGTIEQIARSLDMELDNVRRDGRAVAFKLNPTSSRARYARRSAESFGHGGRRLKACCYHGFRDFGVLLFGAGATRLQSSPMGRTEVRADFHNVHEFAAAWYDLATANIGSIMYPFTMMDGCSETHYPGIYTVINGNDPDTERKLIDLINEAHEED